MDDYNILPYLYASDTLISEASSTMFDFAALDKTNIIVVLPSASLKHYDGEALLAEDPPHFLQDAFLHISHPDEISTAVAGAIRNDSQRYACVQPYRDYLFWGWMDRPHSAPKQSSSGCWRKAGVPIAPDM